ncbi:peptidoglycan-binding protein [Streptomyces sp. NPDC090106]|uniref:peptidoglycan-binding domain-containing protein n=1 Tax=Streptomyces sp. NPDC090106 TaxID=3365946 RepID=UPI0037F16BFB
MPTPPETGQPQDRPVLEPIRVLRPRRTDALAELFREPPQDGAGYESVVMPRRSPEDWEDETQELPPVPARPAPVSHGGGGLGFGPGQRRAAVVIAVAAAALLGFGGALLLHERGHTGTTATPAPTPTPPVSASAPAGPDAVDPDGAGTLREGDSGPEVTDLQQRLLRIPDVYRDGPTDGTYDAVLTEAVARFQLWYGIRGDETGVYGNDTRDALESRTTEGG